LAQFPEERQRLPSNFTNVVKGIDSKRAWFGTDKGLAYYDGVNWAVYCPSLKDGKPEMTVRDADGNVTPVAVATARLITTYSASTSPATTSGSPPPRG